MDRDVQSGDDEQRSEPRSDDQAVFPVKSQSGLKGEAFLRKIGVAEDTHPAARDACILSDFPHQELQTGNGFPIMVPPGEGSEQTVGIPRKRAIRALRPMAGKGEEKELAGMERKSGRAAFEGSDAGETKLESALHDTPSVHHPPPV